MARKKAGIIHVAKEGNHTITLEKEELELFLPHRGKALKIDCIIYNPSEKNMITGLKTLAEDDSDLEGHFPGKLVYPGVCIAECANLAAAVLIQFIEYEIEGYPTVVDFHCSCKRPILPGDEIEIKVELKSKEEKNRQTFYTFKYFVNKKGSTGSTKPVAEGEIIGTAT